MLTYYIFEVVKLRLFLKVQRKFIQSGTAKHTHKLLFYWWNRSKIERNTHIVNQAKTATSQWTFHMVCRQDVMKKCRTWDGVKIPASLSVGEMRMQDRPLLGNKQSGDNSNYHFSVHVSFVIQFSLIIIYWNRFAGTCLFKNVITCFGRN